MKYYSIVFLACWIFVSPLCHAHKPSDSYLNIDRSSQTLDINWAIALRDLEVAVGLDSNANGEITWGEVQAGESRISSYAISHLSLYFADAPQPLTFTELQVEQKSDGMYAVLALQATPPPADEGVSVDYRLLFDIDPTHRGLIAYSDSHQNVTRVASPTSPHVSFPLQGTSSVSVFYDYFIEGVWHIWIGFDHILFLVTLLLPAVLIFRTGQWQPVESPGAAFGDAAKVVTAFTLAHSITLALAVLELASLPSQLVESVIAFSVLVTALNNLRPLFSGSRWQLAFAFGLIHGFGFASVLVDLGLPGSTLATALLGFNFGVEAGQLAIVALIFPLAVWLRRTRFYQVWVFRGGSIAAALIAGIWMVERI